MEYALVLLINIKKESVLMANSSLVNNNHDNVCTIPFLGCVEVYFPGEGAISGYQIQIQGPWFLEPSATEEVKNR